jgi:protease-4
MGSTGGNVLTTVKTPGDSHQEIAVIPIEGIVDDAMQARVDRYITRAREDSEVKAIVLLIDTPGGTVTASDEIYKELKKFKGEKNGIPIVVAMRGIAASGGYYIACAGDYITAERMTITGSIGVLLPSYNLSKMFDKWGIEDNTIVATGATYKTAGSWTRPPATQDSAYLQSGVDSAFTVFKSIVVAGRGARLKDPIDKIANGKVYSGDEALALGLVDEIDQTGYLDAAIAHAATAAGLQKPQVIQYREPPPSLLNLMTSSDSYAGSSKGRGVTVNLDASLMDRLSSPRMMYLYSASQSSMRSEFESPAH